MTDRLTRTREDTPKKAERVAIIFIVILKVTWDIEAGIGFGVTSASDKATLKLMLSRDLHSGPKPLILNPCVGDNIFTRCR